MKKLICLVAALFLMTSMLSLLSGCSNKQKLYVFNCGDYIGEDVIEAFEEKYPQYDVVYDMFDSNEEMYQKLVSSGIPYDVVIPSDYMIERLAKEGRLKEIDTSRLTNYGKIDDSFKGRAYDKDEKYSVAYMWGTLGIMYNTKKVTETVNSWDILWDAKYSKQILMLNSQRDALGLSLKRLGYSMNATKESEINAARDELLTQKPLVADYGVDTLKEAMISGAYALSIAYSGDAYYMMQENPDLNFVVPDEGSNLFVDAMVMPTTGQNEQAAYLFIDFMCSTEIAKANAEYINYSTPQTEALSLLSEEMRNSPVYNPSQEVIARCETFIDLGDALPLYNAAWEKVRLA